MNRSRAIALALLLAAALGPAQDEPTAAQLDWIRAHGVPFDGVDAFLEQAAAFEKVVFGGLMCMPPLSDDPEEARPFFSRTRELAQRLSEDWRGRYTFARLSMGTSADYEAAVLEGATIVRVGSVLF